MESELLSDVAARACDWLARTMEGKCHQNLAGSPHKKTYLMSEYRRGVLDICLKRSFVSPLLITNGLMVFVPLYRFQESRGMSLNSADRALRQVLKRERERW